MLAKQRQYSADFRLYQLKIYFTYKVISFVLRSDYEGFRQKTENRYTAIARDISMTGF